VGRMRKGVPTCFRYRDVSLAANSRYLKGVYAPSVSAPPPATGSPAPHHIGLIAGLAMTGVGVGLSAAGEPTH
jgi:hypothetical protein